MRPDGVLELNDPRSISAFMLLRQFSLAVRNHLNMDPAQVVLGLSELDPNPHLQPYSILAQILFTNLIRIQLRSCYSKLNLI